MHYQLWQHRFLIHFYEKIEVKCIRDPLPFEEVIFRSINTQIAFLDL